MSPHPLLWARMPAERAAPLVPQSPEEALGMMERSHAATIALLPEDDPDSDETRPLTRAWFDGVREACARTGRVPGVERMLFEWWINEPPVEGLTQLPWLFGVWQGHWICWAGTAPWAAADIAAKSTYDEAQIAAGVQFGSDPDNPPATPWPPFGTAALAVPTTILVALSGKPAPKHRLIPATPIFAPPPAPEPPPPPPPPAPVLPAAIIPNADVTSDPEPVELGDEGAAVIDEIPEELGEPSDTEAEAVVDPATEPAAAIAPVPTEEPTAAIESETEAVETAPTESLWAADPQPASVVAPVAPIEAPPQPQNLPPAGWHPDPSGRHALRYWDGTTWTAHAADPGSDTIHDPI